MFEIKCNNDNASWILANVLLNVNNRQSYWEHCVYLKTGLAIVYMYISCLIFLLCILIDCKTFVEATNIYC